MNELSQIESRRVGGNTTEYIIHRNRKGIVTLEKETLEKELGATLLPQYFNEYGEAWSIYLIPNKNENEEGYPFIFMGSEDTQGEFKSINFNALKNLRECIDQGDPDFNSEIYLFPYYLSDEEMYGIEEELVKAGCPHFMAELNMLLSQYYKL